MTTSLVVPGQNIIAELGYLSGHGTFNDQTNDGVQLIASLAGEIQRVDKLIRVEPVKARLFYLNVYVYG